MKSRMKILFMILMIIFTEQLHAQVQDAVNFQIMDGNEPLRGATIYVHGSEPPLGTVTNIDGYATLGIPQGLRTIELSFLGPYITFELPTKTDSVFLNLANWKLLFFHENKRTKKQKLEIDDY